MRVGDELFMATKLKEGAASILSRLGFTGSSAITFPEEMLRFEGAEEEEGAAAAAATATATAAATVGEPTAVLPPSWTALGFHIPSPSPGYEGAGFLAFAEGTGRSIETWETYIKDRRKRLGLPGDPGRPFQWSVQDFYCIAALKLSNIIFAHAGPAGSVMIDRWIQPPAAGGTVKITNPMFIIFWGPQQLLVTKGKIYLFTSKDLPAEFMTAVEGAAPLPEEAARGFVEEEAGHAVIELPAAATAAAATAVIDLGEGGGVTESKSDN